MTDYVIKSYEEGFIEKQAEVGTEVVKEWSFFGQSSAEQLKQAYSRDDFDPETRLYCFKGNKLVGFLTAAINKNEEEKFAFLRLPFILPRHEEVEDLLFNEIVEVLKKKDIKILRAEASDKWGNTLDMIKKWDFEKKEVSFYALSANLNEVALEVDEALEVLPFDYEKDVEPMVEIFIKEYGYPEEAARQNFENIRTFDQVIAHLIVRKDDKLVGRALAYHTDDPKVAVNGMIHGDDDTKKALQAVIFEKSKESNVESMNMLFGSQNKNLIPTYEQFGFKKVGKGVLFEREI